jgi:hypothetical protein
MYRVKNKIWTISNWIWNIWFKKEDNYIYKIIIELYYIYSYSSCYKILVK